MIKLLIGGSPCTHWSIAQKNNREVEPNGLGWELFKNYLIAKEKFNPDYFLYENNKSAAQPIKDQISKELGVPLMYINSALVSAQNRQRFYAFNWTVDQPEDRGIVIRDILESGENLSPNTKSYALTTRCSGAIPEDTLKRNRHTMVAEPTRIPDYGVEGKSRPVTACYAYKGCGEGSLLSEAFPDNPNKQVRDYVAEPVGYELTHTCDYNLTKDGTLRVAYTDKSEAQGYCVYSPEHKSVCIRSQGNGRGAELVAQPIRIGDIGSTAKAHRVYSCDCKSVTINAGGGGQGGKTGLYACPSNGKETTFYEVKDGLITIKGKQYPIKLSDGFYIIRKLTVTECCRLQTLPDDYCRAVSNAQAYKGLGNGWTAEVIIHILNGALKDVPRDEEIVVLSMYDGIGTGRYCLDKMGFTNVKYFAYEIDKYAKQVAMSNYPDIIQCGDAFDLRHTDWTIWY